MTNREFSDTFTTLLNSYNSQAKFGEQASKEEIILDEYEKSVLLTQAQDIIVKSYFDRTLNQQGQGFDDSARRQVDFSSLITVAELQEFAGVTAKPFDYRGILFSIPSEMLYMLNEQLLVYTVINIPSTGTSEGKVVESKKVFVIVPISFKEYDREMSKPYAQPLKKQAWRLFQDEGNSNDYNMVTELIPNENVKRRGNGTHIGDTRFAYKIRYIRRPQPIILENLPNDLKIDGESTETPCELNPILHMDILTKAVELALTTRGRIAPQQEQVRR